MASKRKKTSHKNTANFPNMNVGNSPHLVLDRLFHILPGNVKSPTGSYLVQSGYSDFHRSSKTHVTKPLNSMVFLHGDWLTMTSSIDMAACCFSWVCCPDHQAGGRGTIPTKKQQAAAATLS